MKFRSVFCKDLESQPWLLTNLNEDCVDNQEFYEFCQEINRWCMSNDYSFLFVDYSYEEHLNKLQFDLIKLKEALKIHEKEDPKHRVLVYLADERIIFNIRYLDSNSTSKVDVSNAVRKGQNDAKLFSALHLETLRNSDITFVSLVAASSVSDEELRAFDLCSYCSNNLIITKDDLLNYSGMDNKLSSVLHQRDERTIEDPPSCESPEYTFQCLASQIWGCLSVKDVHLPSMSNRAYNSLVRIYLNNDQRQFLQYRHKHVILKGGYGSGKSILAQSKFKELVQHAGNNDFIYFISYSSESLYKDVIKLRMVDTLKHHLKKEQVNIMNVEEYCKMYGFLRPLMVSDILQDVRKRHSVGNPHIFIDEFDGSNLTKVEGADIKRNLEELRESHILIATQSMEIIRKRTTKEGRREKEIEYSGYNYEVTGMRIETLDLIMRNPTKINDLSRATIRILAKHKNVFFEKEQKIVADSKPASSNTAIKPKKDAKTNIESADHTTEETSDSRERKEKKHGETCCTIDELECDTMVKSVSVNLDHVLKKISVNTERKTGNKIESKFRFHGEWEHGHAIAGDIPLLIYPFADKVINYTNVNQPEIKDRMRFVVSEIIDASKEVDDLAIICFDLIDAHLFRQTIMSMGINVIEYLPALDASANQRSTEDVVKDMKTHVIITDHIGARGLECKQLVVSLDSNEYYLHQYLVEAFTRCIGRLFFTVINKKEQMNTEAEVTCGHIIKQWEKKELVEKHVVDICTTHPEHHCALRSSCGKNGIHNLHRWHSHFEDYPDVEDIAEVNVDMECYLRQFQMLADTQHFDNMVSKRRDIEKELNKVVGKEFSFLEDFLRAKDINKFVKYFKCLMEVKPKGILLVRDNNGNSLLHLAAKYDVVGKPMELMVKDGAIDITNNDECTPLMIAVKKNSKLAVRYLVEQGANLLKINNDGYNVMEQARCGSDEEIINLLKQHLEPEQSEEEPSKDPSLRVNISKPAESKNFVISKQCGENDYKLRLRSPSTPEVLMRHHTTEMARQHKVNHGRITHLGQSFTSDPDRSPECQVMETVRDHEEHRDKSKNLDKSIQTFPDKFEAYQGLGILKEHEEHDDQPKSP